MKSKLALTVRLMLIAVFVCSIVVAEKCRDKKKSLPAEVEKVLMERYPDASIKEVEKDEVEFKVFEVELTLKDGQELDVKVACDGTLMETENEIEASVLPFDLSTVVPQGAQVKEVESEIEYAVFKPVALAQPETTYNLEILVDGKKMEMEVAADGTILEQKVKCDDDDKNGDDDNDDDDNGDDEHDD